MRSTILIAVIVSLLLVVLKAKAAPAFVTSIPRTPIDYRLVVFFQHPAPAKAAWQPLLASASKRAGGAVTLEIASIDARELSARIDPEANDLGDGGIAAAKRAEGALALRIKTNAASAWRALQAGTGLAAELASQGGVAILDTVTVQTYAPATWNLKRRENTREARPNVVANILGFGYTPALGANQVMTLGMEKFGLPNLVVPDVQSSAVDSVITAVLFVAQTLVESDGKLAGGGMLTMDLRSSKFLTPPPTGGPVQIHFAAGTPDPRPEVSAPRLEVYAGDPAAPQAERNRALVRALTTRR